MKCQTVHSALLGSEKPSRLPADVVAHLRGCAPCRVWQRRLVHLERNVALLTVPPAPNGKAAFVRQFLAAPVEVAPEQLEIPVEAPASLPIDSATIVQHWKFDKLAAALRSTFHAPRNTLNSFPAPARRRIAAVLAASLLFLAFGLWTFGPHSPIGQRSPDPLLAQVMKHDVRLAADLSPRERIETLADLADALQNDTRALFDAAGPEDLATLAGCYQKVVSDGIVKQAQALPAGDRTELLNSLAPRLGAAADDAERLARVRPDTTTGPLNVIVEAARKGEADLRRLGAEQKALNRRPPSPPVLFASLALADLQGGPSPVARAAQLRRNVGLIQKVVLNSLVLAGEPDHLKRAAACADMAERLAYEIRLAKDDPERAIELAGHLRAVLKLGVAANLTLARGAIPSGSNDEPQLWEVQDRTATDMQELEAEFPTDTDALDDLKLTRRTVQEGRAAVQKAINRVKTGN